MRFFAVFGPAIALACLALAGCAGESSVPECSEAQLLAHWPSIEERQAHRKFSLPSLTYPFGTELEDGWGFDLRVRVEPSGAVSCYSVQDRYGREAEMNERRRALLSELRQWGYEPFIQNGRAVAAHVREEIREEEMPQAHQPLPDVPLDKVHIGLKRTMCFGSCPSYTVDVYGDGRVVYNGKHYVDVVGEVVYRVPPERVTTLVESLRSKDLWSLRDTYRAPITDNPSYELTLDLGEQVHRIDDYVGEMVGMPQSVTDFEDEIDEVSGASGLVNLSKKAVQRLEERKFDFRSQAGGDLLARAVSNERSRDDEAMLRVIELGAPVMGHKDSDDMFALSQRPVIEAALLNQRAVLIDPLIQRGALETDGVQDQNKIDAAFRAAVAGGRLEAIEKIWSAARSHPSLMFEDESDNDSSLKKTVPVTFLMPYHIPDERVWEGLAVIQWLAARGCDLDAVGADGDTLLHIAAALGQADLVRYLLGQGLDVSAPGRYGLPALASADNEDVALILIVAGADPEKANREDRTFRSSVKARQWLRVLAWLDSH